jgi:hypothetical protein
MEGLKAGDDFDVSLGDVVPTFLQNSAVCLQQHWHAENIIHASSPERRMKL